MVGFSFGFTPYGLWAGFVLPYIKPWRSKRKFLHSFIRNTIMKTFVAKPHEVKRDWFVIDAKGKVLGRVSSEVARRLRGKHKPEFTPHVDTGDYIVVINAADIVVTGAKAQDKRYYRHSTYPGGITETNFQK